MDKNKNKKNEKSFFCFPTFFFSLLFSVLFCSKNKTIFSRLSLQNTTQERKKTKSTQQPNIYQNGEEGWRSKEVHQEGREEGRREEEGRRQEEGRVEEDRQEVRKQKTLKRFSWFSSSPLHLVSKQNKKSAASITTHQQFQLHTTANNTTRCRFRLPFFFWFLLFELKK